MLKMEKIKLLTSLNRGHWFTTEAIYWHQLVIVIFKQNCAYTLNGFLILVKWRVYSLRHVVERARAARCTIGSGEIYASDQVNVHSASQVVDKSVIDLLFVIGKNQFTWAGLGSLIDHLPLTYT